MKLLRNAAVAIVAGLALLSATAVQAQNVARVYSFMPAAGKAAAFEQALAKHAAWRKQAGDPWTWNVYEVVTGDDAGSYLIRSGGHTWADLDAYDAGFGPKGAARFNTDVAPLVASTSSWVSVDDTTHQRLPESMDDGSLIVTTTYYLRPGKGAQFNAVVDAVQKAAAAGDAPTHYAWFRNVGSGPGGTRILAVFHKNWADFQPKPPSLGKVLAQSYGQEMAEQIGRDLTGAVSHTESSILRYRADLSLLHGGS